LTINDVAAILRCSKSHVSHLLAGKVRGIPRLTHIAMGRRKLVRREWLEQMDGGESNSVLVFRSGQESARKTQG